MFLKHELINIVEMTLFLFPRNFLKENDRETGEALRS